MPDGSSQVRKGRKFDQVLEGATSVFLRDGFERASVDDIAKAAGVSKATLYSYFPDKRLLFVEVVKLECQRQANEALEMADFCCKPDEFLRIAGRKLIDVVLSDFGQQIFRMAVTESDRFSELGARFFESGPGLIRASIIPYFEAAIARKELDISDLELASDQFAELCKASLFPLRIMHLQTEFSDAEKTRVVEGAVEMFMARYGVE